MEIIIWNVEIKKKKKFNDQCVKKQKFHELKKINSPPPSIKVKEYSITSTTLCYLFKISFVLW
jgi:hypothetical protein